MVPTALRRKPSPHVLLPQQLASLSIRFFVIGGGAKERVSSPVEAIPEHENENTPTSTDNTGINWHFLENDTGIDAANKQIAVHKNAEEICYSCSGSIAPSVIASFVSGRDLFDILWLKP